MKSKKEFNLIINGVGGQGLITLLIVLAEAALLENYEVRTSELHGLSQRGGSVETHFRLGRKIYSPLVKPGCADVILALEQQEALNGLSYANPQTIFLINQYQTPTLGKEIGSKEILKIIKRVSPKVHLIPAASLCQQAFNTDVVAGIYLLGYATKNRFLPLKKKTVEAALKKIIPEKFLELNLRAFNLSKSKSETKK
ncbi:MAG: indolepyruvate oxidoreductase subunit beta [Minisyncoccales bacterium]